MMQRRIILKHVSFRNKTTGNCGITSNPNLGFQFTVTPQKRAEVVDLRRFATPRFFRPAGG